jgi:hypothetical protein
LKVSPQVVSVFPIRQQIISVCETPRNQDQLNCTKENESTESPDILSTVVIRSSYTTPNGTSERQLICEGGDCPISKVADAMVNEHEKVTRIDSREYRLDMGHLNLRCQELLKVSSHMQMAKMRFNAKFDQAILER